ncbi:hypothetical protein T552_03401 [Pneumocystis carinii B80]|uniref:VPS9 domain-containing protein n=1 Tax=Pneumocystis carinii (strain B80) TaxID=1408658 RepID=A0A0W4ZBS4_PNEC8|nr:hypothetical protein T552_03401 [Pneumocystis carinii B80]KTW25788.1 hypothetical protein T552_03401 [Pneumocystis carinii B80]
MRIGYSNIFLNRLFSLDENNKTFVENLISRGFSVYEMIILVPIAESLQGLEENTGIPWMETIDEDFIQSHILKSSSGSRYGVYRNIKEFTTINGKTVIIKNDFVYSDKGFSCICHAKLLYDMLYYSEDQNRDPYLIYFLDRPLVKTSEKNINVSESISISNKPIEKITILQELLKSHSSVIQKINRIISNSLKKINLLDKSDHLNLVNNIQQIIEDAIISCLKMLRSLNLSSLRTLLNTTTLTEDDIGILVENYICNETYDIVFSCLKAIYKDNDLELIDSITSMEHINIYQLGLPFVNNEINDRIYDAINCFKQFEETKVPSEKLNILMKTIHLLVSNTVKIPRESQQNKNYNENMFQDVSNFSKDNLGGDYLIPLLLLVVVRTKLNYLETDFIYMSHFSFLNERKGQELYAISSLEAVLHHILHQKDKLKAISNYNLRLWDSVKSGDINILDSVFKKEHPSFISMFFDDFTYTSKISSVLKDIYYYKDINGNSAIMLGIKTKQFSSIDFFLNHSQFSLEIILNDHDIEGSTLLMAAIKYEFKEAINILLQKLKECSEDEFTNYLAQEDKLGRTVCHFLFHEPYLILELGIHLSWKSRDKYGQTPLFILSTLYDHPNYKTMFLNAIKIVQLIENNTLNVDDHVDDNGNSLFHTINDSDCLLALLDCKGDINKKNNHGYTPLIYHTKSGNSELVKILLNDKRTYINAKDKNGFTALHFSAQGNLDVMNLLTEVINIEERTSYTGLTALHIAVQEKSLDCINYLVRNKSANINALDYKGDRPVDLATDQEVVDLLDEYALFMNNSGKHKRVVRAVRAIIDNNCIVKFIIKSGFVNGNPKNLITVIRTVEDFKLLYKFFIHEYSESWIPSFHIDFSHPCIIPSKPSKSILQAFLDCSNTFLQALLHHSTFSTHELLWEFFTVPEQAHIIIERNQRMNIDKEIPKQLISIEEVNDADFFFKHAKNNIGNMKHAYYRLYRILYILEFSYLDHQMSYKLFFHFLQTPSFKFLEIKGHLFVIEHFIDNLVLKTHLITELIHTIQQTENVFTGLLNAFERPYPFIKELISFYKSSEKSLVINKNTSWPLNLLNNTRKKIQLATTKNNTRSMQTLLKQSAKLHYTHINLITELADFYNTHIQKIQNALKNFAIATLQQERYKLNQLQRTFLILRNYNMD